MGQQDMLGDPFVRRELRDPSRLRPSIKRQVKDRPQIVERFRRLSTRKLMSEAALFKKEIGNSLRRVVENTERDSKLVQGIIDASGSCIVIIDEARSIV